MNRAETQRWTQLAARDTHACPRPDKRAFPNKQEAKKTLRRMQGTDRIRLTTYRCACGCFHIGHRKQAA